MNYPADVLQRMSQIGVMAADLGLHDKACAIFKGLAAIRYDSPYPRMSLALAQSRAGDTPASITLLRETVAAFPACEMAQVLLAVELSSAGEVGAAHLLDGVIAAGRDAEALELAHAVAAEIHAAAKSVRGHVDVPPQRQRRYPRIS